MVLWSRKLKPYLTGKEERTFTDALEAVAHLESLYSHNILYLRQEFDAFARDQGLDGRVRACYPFIRMHVPSRTKPLLPLSYGYVPGFDT